MNPKSYVQYLTKNGQIRSLEVEREVVDTTIKYTVQGIQDEFFLLNLFDNNKKVVGLTFENVQNLQMIAFLNSDFQSVDALPEQYFMNPFDIVVILKDFNNYDVYGNLLPHPLDQYVSERQNVFVENFPASVGGVEFPEVQKVEIQNPFPASGFDFPTLNVFKNLVYVPVSVLDYGQPPVKLFVNIFDGVLSVTYTLLGVSALGMTEINKFFPVVVLGTPFYFMGLFFKITTPVPLDSRLRHSFDFVIDPSSNTFGLQTRFTDIPVEDSPFDGVRTYELFEKITNGFKFVDEFVGTEIIVQDVPFV